MPTKRGHGTPILCFDKALRCCASLARQVFLAPGDGHGPAALFGVADVAGAVLEVIDEAAELRDRFVVGPLSLFLRGQLGLAEDAGGSVAAGPGDDGGRAGGEKVDPVEGAVVVVE